jgi:membrane-associated phospholipid phosphatase
VDAGDRRHQWRARRLGLIALAGALYYDPRPFVIQHIHPPFAPAADNGFPSDHATLTMFLAVCVPFCSRPWGIVLAVNALMVGAARVLRHVHSPLDIAAGFLIGAAAAAPASWLAPVIVRRIPLASAARPGADAHPRRDQLTRPRGQQRSSGLGLRRWAGQRYQPTPRRPK